LELGNVAIAPMAQTPEIYASEAVCANCFTQIDYRLYILF